jgi:hypothetical protein
MNKPPTQDPWGVAPDRRSSKDDSKLLIVGLTAACICMSCAMQRQCGLALGLAD